MKGSLWARMDRWVRQLIPCGMALLLLLLTVVPTHVPGFHGVAPMLPLMAVFYWSVYRPDLIPAWAAFGIGLLQDVVAGTPLGIGALVLLLAHGVATSQRRFFLSMPFLVTWLAFALVAAGATLLSWLLVSMLYGALIDPRAAAFACVMTLALYPALAWGFARTQVAVLRDE